MSRSNALPSPQHSQRRAAGPATRPLGRCDMAVGALRHGRWGAVTRLLGRCDTAAGALRHGDGAKDTARARAICDTAMQAAT